MRKIIIRLLAHIWIFPRDSLLIFLLVVDLFIRCYGSPLFISSETERNMSHPRTTHEPRVKSINYAVDPRNKEPHLPRAIEQKISHQSVVDIETKSTEENHAAD